MPQRTIKLRGDSGKIYEMPWNKAGDPSDAEIEAFIEAQERPTPAPLPTMSGPFGAPPPVIKPSSEQQSLIDEEIRKLQAKDPAWKQYGRGVLESIPKAITGEPFSTEGPGRYSQLATEIVLGGGIGAGFGGKNFVGNLAKRVMGRAKPPVPTPPTTLPTMNLPAEFLPAGGQVPPVPTRLPNTVPPTPMEQVMAQQAGGRPFKDARLQDLEDLAKRGVKGAKEELTLRKNVGVTQPALVNADILKSTLEKKPKFRLTGQLNEVELLNPNKENIDNALKSGFELIGANPETGSVTLRKVQPLTAPPSLTVPGFKSGGIKPPSGQAADVGIKLPKELSGAKPTYNLGGTSYIPEFQSDLDKAAYIIGRAEKKSARDADYLKFVMDNTGLDENAARAYGARVRNSVKEAVKAPGQGPGLVKIPTIEPSGVGKASAIGDKTQTIVDPKTGKTQKITIPEPRGNLPPDESKEILDFDAVLKAGGAAKSALSGFDLSAPMRQGRMLLHKKEFRQSLTPMLKAASSEEGYVKIMADVAEKAARRDGLATKSGVKFTNLGDKLEAREDAIFSDWPEKLPIAGRGYRASNRAYTAFLNKLRADSFESLVSDYERLYKTTIDDKTARDIANFVNAATGRGDLGSLEKYGNALNVAMFSPRLLASKLYFVDPRNYLNAAPFVRKEMAKSMLQLGVSQAGILGLMAFGGAKIGTDRFSSDFGKAKIGNTRIDMSGGMQPIVRLASQLANFDYDKKKGLTWKPQLVSSKTNKRYDLRHPKGPYDPTVAGVIGNTLFTNKQSPLFSFVHDWARGKDFEGNQFNLPEAVVERLVPLVIQDFYEIYQDDPDFMRAIVLGSPALVGGSVQTYGKKTRKK